MGLIKGTPLILLYLAYVDVSNILIWVCISLSHYFYEMCPRYTHLGMLVAHRTVWPKNYTILKL
jgi:hypothetical protein